MTNTNLNTSLNKRFDEFFELFIQKFKELDTKIDTKFTELDKKFTTKFTELDKKFTELDAKFEKRFLKIDEKLVSINNYIKNTSDAYEEKSLIILFKYLQYKIYTTVGNIQINKILLKKIYFTTNKDLTDLDGCLLVDKNFTKPYEKDLKRILNSYNIKPIQGEPNLRKKLENNLKITDDNILYVVESKNHIIKTDVDKKIKQMIDFQKIIKDLKENKITLSEGNFKNMVTNYNISNYPLNIYLYLATDNISPLCRIYIEHIYKGTITEEIYKELTYNMIIEYKGFQDFIDDVKKLIAKDEYKNFNTTKLNFNFKNYASIKEFLNEFGIKFNKKIREAFLPEKIFEKGYCFFKTFVINFTDLQDDFNWAKEHIGLIYLNEVIEYSNLPPILPFNSSYLPEEKLLNNAPQSSYCDF
jgi:hypothetical protein